MSKTDERVNERAYSHTYTHAHTILKSKEQKCKQDSKIKTKQQEKIKCTPKEKNNNNNKIEVMNFLKWHISIASVHICCCCCSYKMVSLLLFDLSLIRPNGILPENRHKKLFLLLRSSTFEYTSF